MLPHPREWLSDDHRSSASEGSVMESAPFVAQTAAQLYHQLLELGYGDAELARVRDAHEWIAGLHAVRFRPNGRPFLCHAVGTASILAGLGVEGDVVLTGLLHGVYDHGDFGGGTRGIEPWKRAIARDKVGEPIEERIAAFCALEWSARGLDRAAALGADLDPLGRDTLLVRLANELEELLDFEIQFRRDADARMAELPASIEVEVELAHRLGQPELASAFAAAGVRCSATRLPAFLRGSVGANHDRVPQSLGRRPGVVAADRLRRLRGWAARAWTRLTGLVGARGGPS
jgi:hypothetical protein